jgi:PAS domain S-box-containing protein
MHARATARPQDFALPAVRALARLHELVALTDRRGRVVWTSEPLARLCGSGFGAAPWLECLAKPASAEMDARLATRRRLAGEAVGLRGRDGAVLPARVWGARVSDDAGCEVSVLLFRLVDRGPELEDFRRRLEDLSPLLEASPDGVAVVDRSGFLSWASPALAELTGFSHGELVDQPLALWLQSPRAVEAMGAALHGAETSGNAELELRRKDGEALLVSVHARALASPEGVPLGSVIYLRDVSDRRQVECELSRRAEELQSWVNAVSHDLRSPLVAVLGFTRLLHEDYSDRLDEQGIRFLRRIEEAGRTMEALVHDLLEFARIGRSEPRRVHVDPRDVLLQLQAELKPRLEEAQVELCLPEEPPLIWCDRTQLYQVLSNLVGNALDHAGTPPAAQIEVDVVAQDGGQLLVVRDHGRGIDPADHERIFEIFQTRGVPRNGKRGTGIGLAIVRKIAEAHGGSAWVESRPGEGAAFHVIFPSA